MKAFISLNEAAAALAAEIGGSERQWFAVLETACDELNLIPPKREPNTLPGGVAHLGGPHLFRLRALRSLGDPARLAGNWLMPAAAFNQWRTAHGYAAPGSAPGKPPARDPVQRQTSHEEKILAALRSAGYDPLRLPIAPSGRPNPAKKAAKAKLVPKPLTKDVFDKTWQRLRNDGKIQDAKP